MHLATAACSLSLSLTSAEAYKHFCPVALDNSAAARSALSKLQRLNQHDRLLGNRFSYSLAPDNERVGAVSHLVVRYMSSSRHLRNDVVRVDAYNGVCHSFTARNGGNQLGVLFRL